MSQIRYGVQVTTADVLNAQRAVWLLNGVVLELADLGERDGASLLAADGYLDLIVVERDGVTWYSAADRSSFPYRGWVALIDGAPVLTDYDVMTGEGPVTY